MSRKHYNEEFKREAVRLAIQPGVTVTGIARDLGINVSILRRWVKEAGNWNPDPGQPLKSDIARENERLKRELSRVRMERDILKKALGYFAKDPA
jgi:transposase